MILQHLRLRYFRTHQETEVSFSPGVNLIHGPNGAGKTNLLEAVHYLGLTKSFLVSKELYVLQRGAPFMEIEGRFNGMRRAELKVRLAYARDEGKRVFVNGAPLERLSDLIGQVPVVVFAPEDHVLTAGGPEERRKFLNNILSQAYPVYLDDILKYRRALRQRNELLHQYRRRPLDAVGEASMQAWDAEVVQLGSRLVHRRLQFLDAFAGYLERAYHVLGEVVERPSLRYQSLGSIHAEATLDEVATSYRHLLKQHRRREQEQGRTLIGPHRDEVIFSLNNLEVRRYASQGQHRTLGLALKLAQYLFLQERLEESPILLLDDIFGHFDAQRTEAFLALLQGDLVGQVLITDTRLGLFEPYVDFRVDDHQHLSLQPGRAPDGTARAPGDVAP
ncbi:MAG: DNA replication/repair protein RecF [Bacteroidota bacterium]